MSVIASQFNITLPYPQLTQPKIPELCNFTNMVLIVIDGLGYNYLKQNGKGTRLLQNTVGSLSTVFPATTASGISTICTGLAPQQHALTGWFMHTTELEGVIRILPYTLAGKEDLLDLPIEKLIDVKPLGVQLKSSSAIVGEDIAESPYTRFMSGNAKISSYTDLKGFFNRIIEALSDKTPHFIYAYWPSLDTINHFSGPESSDSKTHFLEINEGYEQFLETIENTNTLVIVISDHGFIDTNSSKRISMDDHLELSSYLDFPLCGEPRAAYCYVREGMVDKFTEYIDSQLGYMCDFYYSRDLVTSNWFGLFEPNKKLYERIGDYTLIPKENYYFEQKYSEKESPNYLGLHGGISNEEMLIPLIIATSWY
jgi:predicted AlkP superfamily pyrophosphatase or phosphodiesterase